MRACCRPSVPRTVAREAYEAVRPHLRFSIRRQQNKWGAMAQNCSVLIGNIELLKRPLKQRLLILYSTLCKFDDLRGDYLGKGVGPALE